MFLLINWIVLAIASGSAALYTKMIDDSHFWLFCFTIYYFTYLYNKINPINLSLRLSAVLIIPSSLLLSYILYHYNWFLNLNPLSEETFMFICSAYFYIIIHIICELHVYNHNYKMSTKKFFIVIFSLSLIIWYFIYNYKEEFSYDPMTNEKLNVLLWLYLYIGIYFVCELTNLLQK